LNRNEINKEDIYFVLPFCIRFSLILSIFIYNANKILKYELDKFPGKGFAVENIELGWGSAQAEKSPYALTNIFK